MQKPSRNITILTPSNEECGLCNGTGVTDCPLEYGGRHPENCPACGGDQTIVCPDCDGTGKQN